jgi:CBS domain-containing protein
MTEDPLCCLPDTPLAAVARLMAENSCGAIPVIAGSGDRRPVGMVTDRDLALRSVAEGLNPLAMAARDVMTPSPVSIAPDASAEEGAELMRQHRLRRILVVDGTGTLRGLLAQGQIASNLPHDRSGGMVRGISRPNP